jgi:uncharacterized delta-60 repeat protein
MRGKVRVSGRSSCRVGFLSMSLRNFIRHTRLLIQQGLYETRKLSNVGQQRALQLTRLEERVLFSASVLAPVVAEIAEVGGSQFADSAPVDDATTFHVSDRRLLDLVAGSALPAPAVASDSDSATDQQTLELVFLDSSIDNLDQIISGLESQSELDSSRTLEFVILDSTRDGIAQITSALLRYNGIDGLHIVSQGDGGEVQLGSTTLSLDNLDRYRTAISAWQYSMSDKADILFYGCDLTNDEQGQTLLSELSELTHTDVAASDDLMETPTIGGTVTVSALPNENVSVASSSQIATTSSLGFRSPGSTAQSTDASLQFTTDTGHVLDFGQSSIIVAAMDHVLQVEMVGANSVPPLSENSDAATGAGTTGSQVFTNVTYAGLWDGITATFDATEDAILKSTYYVDAGAAVGQIQLKYNRSISLDQQGNLVIGFENGTMTDSAPVAWQDIDGQRIFIDVHYALQADNQVGFSVGAYDHDYQLVIDPTLTWSTFLGGSGTDDAQFIAVDGSGNIFVTGSSSSTWGTPVRGFGGGVNDAYVAKLNSSGNVVWTTFLGGSGTDLGHAIAVDASGNIYVSGDSSATWGSPVQAKSSGTDGFAAKLNSSGTLVWNTFLGGSGSDTSWGIGVDSSGNVYVSGDSTAAWGSPVRAYSSGTDVYAAKLNSSGSLTWSTFLGGSGSDVNNGIAVDSSGNVYVGGYSTASWGTPVRAYTSGQDFSIIKLDTGGSLIWNTFLGGSGTDAGLGIAVDSSSNVYVTGNSSATWGSPVNAISSGTDAVAAKLNSSGSLVWNTFLGGSGTDNGRRIAVDGSGNVFVVGSSTATWGSPDQAYTNGTDGFAAELDSSGNRIWHTFVGGGGTDVANGIAVDGGDNIYLAGSSTSTWGSPLQSLAGGQDAFVAKFSPETTLSKRIGSASDDAEEEGPTGTTPGTMWLDSSDIELVSDFDSPSTGEQKVGLRFTGMNIPVGATITDAYLVFRAISADSGMNNSGATSLTVNGQLTGNASTFTTTSGNISSRTLTTASTAWTPSAWTTGLDYNSPDISSVVQEIVNQGTWASGNALAIIISGTGHRASQAYDSDPSNAAQLVVTYTTAPPVNNAPVLDNSGTMTLTSINEDQTSNAGNTVSSIIASASGNRITDVDSGAVEGIAITSLVSSNGTWQYSTNAGTSWTNVGAVSSTSALLLRDTDLVRFVPNTQTGTTASFDFRAWDQTSGSAGTRADASINGGTTAFSSSTETASIVVSDVNDSPSFDSGTGLVATGFSVGATDFINAIAIQPDGKIVAVGYTQNAGNNDFAIVRYNADGSLDTSFGSGTGKVTTAIGASSESAQSVVILSNGKILVAGSSFIGGGFDIALVQYNADGTLDTSFGGGTGISTSGIFGSDEGYALAVQSDGRILVAGGTNNDFILARFLSNGLLDTSFGTSGSVTTDFAGGNDRALSMSLQSDGKILLGGYAFSGTSFDFAVARYNTDGTLDTTFNGTDQRLVDIGTNSDDSGRSLTLQPDGKILIAGWSDAGGTNDFGLVRLNANGSLDTTFNGTGKVTTAIGTGSDLGVSVTVQADGKILMVGQSNTAGNNFAAVRYNSNGSLDTTFNGTGKVDTNFGGSSDDRGHAIAVQTDGKIVLGGTSTINGSHDFAVARYNADGTFDTRFNTSNTLGGTIAYTENAAAVVLDSSVTVFDAELSSLNNFSGVTLTLTRNGGANAEDLFWATGLLATLTQGDSLVYSGTTIGTVTTNSGGNLVLTFNSNATQTLVNSAMRLIAYSNSSDAPPLSVQINWTFSDGNSGVQGTGGALTANGFATINITSVNDAPALDFSKSPVLVSQNEDSDVPAGAVGTLVSLLVDSALPVGQVDNVTDADSGASLGIAITAANTTNGTHWYSTNNGSSWIALGAVSDTSARLLAADANTRIFFQPNADYNGTIADAITFRAWDQTNGSNGSLSDTSTNGGSTSYSSATDTAALTIVAVNDLPEANNDVGSGSEDNNISGNVLANDTDIDGDLLTATLTAGPANGGLVFNADGSFTYTPNADWNGVDSFQYLVNDGSGLVHYWGLEGNGTDSIGGDNGTPTNSPTQIAGKHGIAYQFDGIDDHLALPDISYSNEFSLSFFFRVSDNSGNGLQYFYSHGTLPTAGLPNTIQVAMVESGYSVPSQQNTIVTTVWDSNDTSGQIFVDVASLIGDGQWHAYTMTVKSGTGTQVYIDGMLRGSAATGGDAIDPTGNLYFGARTDLDPTRMINAGGALDSISIFNRALNAAEASQLATNSVQASVTLTVNNVNDAPVMDPNGTMTLTTITEDDINNSGDLASAIIASAGGDRIIDVDAGALEGIAIFDLASGNGIWQYNTGSGWNDVGAVSIFNSLLLRDTDSLRFEPNGQNADTAFVSFAAWDQTTGTAGTKVNTSIYGGTTAFSNQIETAAIIVTAVNDAPVLADTALGLTIAENSGAPSGAVGELISTFIGGITDVDSGAVKGIAIVASDETNGTWYYSTNGGSSWTAVGTVNSGSSLLLADNANTRLYFQPNASYNGTSASALTIRAWDQTGGGVAGTKVSTASTGGTNPFSAVTDVIDVTVPNSNDAPVLDNSGTMSLTTINEDDAGNSGNTVASIIASAGGDRITDVDSGALEGIAISGLGGSNGTWQYNTGSGWTDVGVVSANSALLLRATDSLRFQPNGSNGDFATVLFQAWDQTTGTAATKVDSSVAGGTTAFSSQVELATLTIAASNDAPVPDTSGTMTLTTINEDQTSNGGNTIASIIASAGGDRITDVDSGAVEGVAITSLSSGNGTWEYSTNGGATWSAIGAVSDSSALLVRSTDLVRFVPDGNNGTVGSFDFRAWDQTSGVFGTKVDVSINGGTTAFSTATETASITVSSVNDAPLYNTGGTTTLNTINEDQIVNGGQTVAAIVLSAGGNRIGDADAGAVEGIAIRTTYNGNGTWQYSLNGGSTWLDVGAVSDGASLLLRDTDMLRFVPDGNNGMTANMSVRAWDQKSGTAGTKVNTGSPGGTTAFSVGIEWIDLTVISVNDAPVLDNTGSMTLNTIDEDQASNGGQTVASVILSAGGNRITDVDTGAIEGIAITTLISGTGTWQYSINSGTDWLNIGTVSNTSALLLRDTDLVRFVPDGNNGTAGSFDFRAWDQTVGTAGTKVTTATNGGTSEFSTAVETASITVTDINDAPTGSVTIDNTTPAQGETLTASNTLADADGMGAIAYTWQADGSTIGTGATYVVTEAEVNKVITVIASYTDGRGTNEAVTSATTAAVTNVNDAPTGSVTIDNTTPAQGETLTASNTLADADGMGAITYTWQADGSTVGTGSTYVVTEAEVNKVITVIASYTDGHGTNESVTSAATAAVTNVNDVPTGSVTIDNTTPSQGDTLTASNTLGDADGMGAIAYTWQADGSTIGTGATHVVTEAEVNKVITVIASYTDGHGTNESVTSAATAAVTNVNDVPTGSVTINNTTPAQGDTLTASNTLADADGMGAITYTWQADGSTVGTGSTYVVTEAEVNKVIAVIASYTDGHGTNEAVTSAPTAAVTNVNDAPTGSVTIDNTTPSQGDTLTASNTLADADGMGAITYTWQADGSTVGTGSTYVVTEAEVNKVIAVIASYTDGHGTNEAVTSAATAAVTNVNDAPTGSVMIDNTTPAQGDTLTASNTLADADGLGAISYTWQADGATVGTGTTYVVTEAEVNKVITVIASYTDGHGTSEAVTSAATAAVTNVNDAPTGLPMITGVATEDQILTADISGINDSDGLGTFSYQWLRNGLAIGGAISNTYLLGDTDVGTFISVEVRYTDGHGTAEGPLTSAQTGPIANVNDEEVLLTNAGLTVSEGNVNTVIGQSLLETTDIDNTPDQIVYTLTLVPSTGALRLNGTLLISGETLTQADINAGLLTYNHNDAEVFADSFSFTVDDGSGPNTAGSFSISITPVNDNTPIITSDGGSAVAALSIAENFTAVTTVTATDADSPNQTLTFSIAGGPDAARFSILSNSGELSFTAAQDFESPTDSNADNSYEVIVAVSDGQGRTSQQTILVTVTDVNETPITVLSDSNGAANFVLENSANGSIVGITAFASDADGTDTVSYSLDDTAGGRFGIDAVTGVVTVVGSINRESASSYTITVRATSTDTSTVTRIFTIAIGDVNEFVVGPVTDSNASADSVAENATIGTTVGITALASDADATINAVTYTLDNNAGGRFAINSITGVVTVAGALDYETATGHNITVRATSADGSFSTQLLTFNVTDVNDNAPEVTANQQFSVSELAGVGTVLGDVAATDADKTGTRQGWTITGGNTDGVFAINSATGRITVADDTRLDFETTSFYSLTVTVSDGVNVSSPQTINIVVLDQNEAPTFSILPGLSVNENAVNVTVVGTAAATDQDVAESLTYSIVSSSLPSAFAIDAVSGAIRVIHSTVLDYEAVSSVTLNLRVTDAAGLTDTQIVTISINDVNETPIDLVLSGGVVAENSTGGTLVGIVIGSDPDAGDVFHYALTSNGGGRFVIDAMTGAIHVAAGALLDYEVSSSHTVTVRTTDSFGLTYDESLTITVSNVNDAPVAKDDSYTALQMQKLNAVSGVLVNDHDEDGQQLTAILVSGPLHGSLMLHVDGTFQYQSSDVFSGLDVFRYRVTDGTLFSNIVTVSIDVLQSLSSGIGSGTGSGSGGSGSSSGNTPPTNSSGSTKPDTSPDNAPSTLSPVAPSTVVHFLDPGFRIQNQGSQDSVSEPGTTSNGRGLPDSVGDALLNLTIFTEEVSVNREGPKSSRSGTVTRVLTTLWNGSSVLIDPLDAVMSGGVFVYRYGMEAHEHDIAADLQELTDIVIVGSSAVVSTSVSVGYVIWILRGGSLLTAFMSASPAWQSFDPLPILQSFDKNGFEDEETLLKIVTKKTCGPEIGKK